MRMLFLVMAFVVGACFGSFLCCQARRLHLKTTKAKKLGKRSVCLKCKTQLKWYDNIPIVSWLVLKGKCRKCGKKIGIGEIIAELASAVAFLLVGLNFDFENIWYSIVLVIFVINFLFLAIYDGLYGELPTFNLWLAVILALGLASFDFVFTEVVFAVAILGGTYLGLYLVSKGKWVGDGDWILGAAIGLALGNAWLALIVLFLANFFACLVMLPLTRGKNHKIPFGPFLVAAFIVVYSFADILLSML